MTEKTSGAQAVADLAADALGVEPVIGQESNGSGPHAERGRVRLHDGREYVCRRIGGIPDVEFLQRCRERQLFARFYGPPGTGKSALCRAAFGSELIELVGSEGTSEEDIRGGFAPEPGGEFAWFYGRLAQAMKEGRPILIDEVNAISPRVVSAMNGVFDGRLELGIPERGETIKAAEGFYCVLAYNDGVAGFELSEAFQSRFGIAVYQDSDYQVAHDLGVNPDAVAIAKRLQRARRKHGEATALSGEDVAEEAPLWIPQLREMLTFKAVEEVFGPRVAAENLLGVCPEEARPQLVDELADRFAESVPLAPLAVQ